MLTNRLTRDGRLSVTRCEFADLAALLSGSHITEPNRAEYIKKLASINAIQPGSFTADWYGQIANVAAAQALVDGGWADGAKQAANLAPSLANIVTPVKSNKRRPKFGEDGADIDVDRAIAGDWDKAFRYMTRVPGGRPRVLSLGCNFGGNGSVSHAELFWCAAQMIVTTDILENAGYAVELHALKCNDVIAGKQVFLDVLVKRPEQPMRADTVAAVFGHAGVYRTFGHCLLMTAPFDIGYGYGRATKVAPALKRAADEKLIDAPDYVLEHAYDMATAAKNIAAALTTLTGQPANV